MKISERMATIYQLAEEIEAMSDNYSEVFSCARAIQEEVNELDKKVTEIQEFLKNIHKYGVDEEKLDMLLYILSN